jgi:hypothetical protein
VLANTPTATPTPTGIEQYAVFGTNYNGAFGANTGWSPGVQRVCLDASRPADCPSDALLLGFPIPGGWNADRRRTDADYPWPGHVPNGEPPHWVYDAAITPDTTGAGGREFCMRTTVSTSNDVTGGKIWLAVDDRVTVKLDGQILTGWLDVFQGTPITLDNADLPDWTMTEIVIPGSYIQGKSSHEFEFCVHNKNTPDSRCTDDTYRCKPAGIAIQGALWYE